MTPYANPKSGIVAYEYGDDWIRVRYKTGETYEYKSPPIDREHIKTMKGLADSQDDLGTYINTHRDAVYSKCVKLS